MVEIEYVWHDCFAVSAGGVNMVFDYWLDCEGRNEAFPSFLERFDVAKPLYVFVSHSHKDHYNPAIFGWAHRFPNIRYFVSRDVWKRMRHIVSATSVYTGPKVDPALVTVMCAAIPGQQTPAGSVDSFADGNLTVCACPSTDVGNSYLVQIGGRRFFHAGDLNAWVWKDESTEAEIRKALGDYRACLRYIGDKLGENTAIDFCFFPVDSRIGRDYWEGAAIFVREFDVRSFIPMHFDLGDEAERKTRKEDAYRFEHYANPDRGEYISFETQGEVFIAQ